MQLTPICMVVPFILVAGVHGQAQDLTYTYIDLGINKGGQPNNTEFYDHSLLFNETEQDLKQQVLFRINDRGRVAGWVTRSVIGVGSVPIAATWLYDARRNALEFQELSELPDASNRSRSWATAISERGVIAGMTALPDEVFGDDYHANATLWKQEGAGWSQLDLALGQDPEAGGESGAFDITDIVSDGQFHVAVCGGVDRPRCSPNVDEQGLRSFRFTTNDESLNVIEPGDMLRYQYATSFLDDDILHSGGAAVGPGIYASLPRNPCTLQEYPAYCCHTKRSRSYLLDFESSEDVDMRYLEENTICSKTYPSWDINSDFERDAMAGHTVGHLRDNLESNVVNGPCVLRATHRATPTSFPEILPLLPVLGGGEQAEQHTRALGIGLGHEGTLQATGFSVLSGFWQTAVLWNQEPGGTWEDINLQGVLEEGRIDINGLDDELNPGTLELITAHDVNRNGWIVGIARVNPQNSSVQLTRPFLLIPDTCPLPPCPGDFNGDGMVDGDDISALLGAWGTSLVDTDLNCDGETNSMDLAILLGNWGPC